LVDNIEREKYALITRGKNAEAINKITEDRGFFITLGDIERGSFGDCGDGDVTYIEVAKILKGGGIKVQLWMDGNKRESINLERIELPDGGVVFAP
jgi:hypothetical protein